MNKNKHLDYFLKHRISILSFFLPVIILLVIFVARGIYPFGERSFLHIDMYHQYFPFLVEFYHKLKSGDSLFYSWSTGIGSNFLALYVYYLASPVNWLVALCPEKHLMEFITYWIVIKLGLSGLTFSYYLRKHFHSTSDGIILFSLFYSLSGYLAAYNWNVMWLDCVVLAPLIILGLEKLVMEGKYKLYCLTLALAILSNYYICIMICMYLVLYFIVLLISAPKKGRAILQFGFFSALAGGIAAVLVIPEISALMLTEFTGTTFPSKITTYFPILDVLARHFADVTVETGLDHWPNIYCGVAVFLFVPLYIGCKTIPLKDKVAKLLLLLFLMVSFSTNTLTFIWHGMNYPDSLPSRQSFLYILLLLTVCFEAFLHLKEFSNATLMRLFPCVIVFIVLCEKLVTDDAFSTETFFFSAAFLVVYGILIYMYKNDIFLTKYIILTTLLAVCLESGINTALTSIPTVSRTNYLADLDSYTALASDVQKEDASFYRIEKAKRTTQNDAMLTGFHSATLFSSTSNGLVNDFYGEYGMRTSKVFYCYDGATPLMSSLLSTKYFYSKEEMPEDSLYQLVGKEGAIYLYQYKYTLPLGYMVQLNQLQTASTTSSSDSNAEAATDSNTSSTSEDTETALNELFESAENAEEIVQDENTVAAIEKGMNPVEKQNLLASRLGMAQPVFSELSVTAEDTAASIHVLKDSHIYAYVNNKKVASVTAETESTTTQYKKLKNPYVLDLGWQTAGSVLTLKSDDENPPELDAYALNEESLQTLLSQLNHQTLQIDSYDSTHIKGTVEVEDPGYLVLSVAYEPGWTLLVDGKKSEINLFEDTFISVSLPKGTHSISLSYYPEGLTPGILISICSILLFGITILVSKLLSARADRSTLPQN